MRKPLKINETIELNILYSVKIPINDFTGYGISKSKDINIRDWYLTFSTFENGNWKKESNLDLNDLTHDPAYFKFKLEYPKTSYPISDITPNSTYENQNTIVFVSKKELRKILTLFLLKNQNFKFTLPKD